MTSDFRPAPRSAEEAKLVRREYNRRCVGAGFMYFGVCLVWQMLVGALYAIALVVIELKNGGLDADVLMEKTTANSMLLTGISNLLTLITIWILLAARRCRFAQETGLRRTGIVPLGLMLPLGASCFVLVSSLLSLLPADMLTSYAESAAVLTSTDPLSVICTVFIAPFAEEVIFRGLLYTRLKRGMNMPLALLIASVIFALMHGQLIWSAYAFMLSLLFIGVLEWTGSLWPCVVLHICFNASQFLIAPYLGALSVQTLLIASVLLSVPLILLARRSGLRSKRL